MTNSDGSHRFLKEKIIKAKSKLRRMETDTASYNFYVIIKLSGK